MKVSVSPVPTGVIKAKDMCVGQVGEVLEHPYHGHLVLRSYDGFVSLDHPQITWTRACTLDVRVLPVGTKITLTLDI
jgi:hypothetical protein